MALITKLANFFPIPGTNSYFIVFFFTQIEGLQYKALTRKISNEQHRMTPALSCLQMNM